MSQIKVLFAITGGGVGGAQEHVRILACKLLELGHQVGIATQPASPLVNTLESEGAIVFEWDHIRRNLNPKSDFMARKELHSAIEKFNPSVLHLHSAKAGILGRGLMKKRGVTVFTCHHPSFGTKRKPSHRMIGRPVEQLTLPLVDGIITVGVRDLAMLQNLAKRVPVRHIRNAVDVPTQPLSPAEPTHNALWVARLESPKLPSLAIKAWAKVIEEVPDAKLTICGSGSLLSGLVDLVHKLDVSHAVNISGFTQDLTQMYQESSYFILTSLFEGGFTMATLEAMSHGLIPIVSDAGDLPFLALNRSGIVVGNNFRQIGASIVQTMREVDAGLDMRQRAISLAKDWTPSDNAAAHLAFYKQLLDMS